MSIQIFILPLQCQIKTITFIHPLIQIKRVMSYAIAKSISISKGKITIVRASNNLFPRHYQKTMLDATRENFKWLLKHLDNGCIQPIDSANKYKWWFISLEMGKMSFTDDEARLDHFIKCATKRNEGSYIVKHTLNDMLMVYKQRYGHRRVFPTYDPKEATRFNEYQARYMQIKYRNYFNAIEQVK